MNFIILQSQTMGSAALEIILMLLGAGLIAAITTYLYCKAKFGKEISQLKLELGQRDKKIRNLEEELDKARGGIAEKDREISRVESQIADLQ
jgi:peptidoglycan hydrolase CwlO-like protein